MLVDPMNPAVQRIAKRLADMWSPTETVQISEDGMRLPRWVFFVSEAQQIWNNHLAANNLEDTYDRNE